MSLSYVLKPSNKKMRWITYMSMCWRYFKRIRSSFISCHQILIYCSCIHRRDSDGGFWLILLLLLMEKYLSNSRGQGPPFGTPHMHMNIRYKANRRDTSATVRIWEWCGSTPHNGGAGLCWPCDAPGRGITPFKYKVCGIVNIINLIDDGWKIQW